MTSPARNAASPSRRTRKPTLAERVAHVDALFGVVVAARASDAE